MRELVLYLSLQAKILVIWNRRRAISHKDTGRNVQGMCKILDVLGLEHVVRGGKT